MVEKQKIRAQAMGLSSSERASLAHDLILSLEDSSDFALGNHHEAEIQRRLQAVRDGSAKGRPASEIFEDIRAKFA